MKISETLANLRRERKMTVRALAQATGLNISNISLIETGKRIPQIDTLIKILDALDAELMITQKGRSFLTALFEKYG